MSRELEPTDVHRAASPLQGLDIEQTDRRVETAMDMIDWAQQTPRRPRTALLAGLVLLVAACGPTSVAPTQPTEPVVNSPGATGRAVDSPQPSPSKAGATMPDPIVLPSTEPEPPLERLWEAAGPAAAKGWTWTPAIDPQGRIWAASSFDHVFWIFDRDGTYIESWGEPGTGDGQFRFPVEGNGFGAIAFRPDGSFYVADSGNDRVQQFDADRNFVRDFGGFGSDEGELISPIDIDLDAEGNVYVQSDGPNGLQMFDPEGAFVRTVAKGTGPFAAVDPDGRVYAVELETQVLRRYLPDGTVDLAVDLKPLLTFATGLAVSPSGDLFIPSSSGGGAAASYVSLLQLNPDGGVEHFWPNGAEAIAVDPAGDRFYATYSDVTVNVEAFALPTE